MSTAAASASKTAAVPASHKLTEAQVAQRFQALRADMQGIATKIGELENDAEEHRAVIDTLSEAQKTSPDRRCFRMIGGVLVERTVRDVLPALEANMAGLKTVVESLVKQYKAKEDELQALQRDYA